MDLWWDCYFDNNINKLTIHETEIHYGDKVSTVKGDTVFWGTESELFNIKEHPFNFEEGDLEESWMPISRNSFVYQERRSMRFVKVHASPNNTFGHAWNTANKPIASKSNRIWIY